MNEFVEFKNHPSVSFVINFFHKNVNLRNMLTKFIKKITVHTAVRVAIKAFFINKI